MPHSKEKEEENSSMNNMDDIEDGEEEVKGEEVYLWDHRIQEEGEDIAEDNDDEGEDEEEDEEDNEVDRKKRLDAYEVSATH